jgi:hypothetical protein
MRSDFGMWGCRYSKAPGPAWRAVRNVFAHRDACARPPEERPEVAPAVTQWWRQRLASPAPLAASESFQLLADYGIPVAPTLPAASLPEAITAAERIGWPVVLKTAAAGIAHKSDAGGVRLGIRRPRASPVGQRFSPVMLHLCHARLPARRTTQPPRRYRLLPTAPGHSESKRWTGPWRC